MKKTFKTFTLMLLTAFALLHSTCPIRAAVLMVAALHLTKVLRLLVLRLLS